MIRKSSINALAPLNVKSDADGFESIDDYFPLDENATPQRGAAVQKKKGEWSVKNAAAPVEYEAPVNYNDYDDNDGGYEEPITTAYVASPDVEDQEIVFRRSVRARPSLSPTAKPLGATTPSMSSTQQKKQSRPSKTQPATSAEPKLKRKRSLLAEPLVALPDLGDDFDEKRKSHRKRFAPLAFWKNEKVVYGRRDSTSTPQISDLLGMPVIVDVLKKNERDDDQSKKKRRRQRRKAAIREAQERQRDAKRKVNVLGVVRDYETKGEIEARTYSELTLQSWR